MLGSEQDLEAHVKNMRVSAVKLDLFWDCFELDKTEKCRKIGPELLPTLRKRSL